MVPDKQNEWHGPITLRVLCRDMNTCVRTKSSLIVLDPLNKREAILAMGNLVPGPVMSQVTEKNIQPVLY